MAHLGRSGVQPLAETSKDTGEEGCCRVMSALAAPRGCYRLREVTPVGGHRSRLGLWFVEVSTLLRGRCSVVLRSPGFPARVEVYPFVYVSLRWSQATIPCASWYDLFRHRVCWRFCRGTYQKVNSSNTRNGRIYCSTHRASMRYVSPPCLKILTWVPRVQQIQARVLFWRARP
jgi:hypothetical protein